MRDVREIRPIPDTQPMTETREGIIPGILVNIDGNHNYWLVVKLRNRASCVTGSITGALRLPQRDDKGRLVYAVPGGGSYVPGAPA